MTPDDPLAAKVSLLLQAVSGILLGKEDAVRMSVLALLAGGHLLLEDVPGVGKTTLAQALARSIDGRFKRIQFTSDILPADILGVAVFLADRGDFQFRPGPVFANVVLADEINRATPKTQSALLEAMNERRVTMDSAVHPLPEPFIVLATQNPAEFHGTFPLPESQLDRFFMRIRIGYPDLEAEKRVLSHVGGMDALDSLQPVLTGGDVLALGRRGREVAVDGSLLDYMMGIVSATRRHPGIQVGVSPRGSLALYRAAQVHALLSDRAFVVPDDVKRVAVAVLAHRILLKKKYAHLLDVREEAETLLAEIVDSVSVPL